MKLKLPCFVVVCLIKSRITEIYSFLVLEVLTYTVLYGEWEDNFCPLSAIELVEWATKITAH